MEMRNKELLVPISFVLSLLWGCWLATLGFNPLSQWKKSICGTTDAPFFLFYFSLHAQEERKNVLLFLFLFLFYF